MVIAPKRIACVNGLINAQPDRKATGGDSRCGFVRTMPDIAKRRDENDTQSFGLFPESR